MSPRALAILAILLGGALAALLWLDRREPSSEDDGPAEVLIDLAGEEPTRIEIAGGPETVRLDRVGGGWALGGSLTGDADPESVDNLIRALREARVVRIVEDRTDDPSRYGLSPPVRALRLSLKGRPSPVGLTLGRPSPVAWQRYVGRDDGSIVLVDGSLGTALERGAASFREMRLFPLAAARIQRLEIIDPVQRVALERRGTEWWVRSPFSDRADHVLAERIARTAGSIRFERIDTQGSRKEGPARVVTVWEEGEGSGRAAEIALTSVEGMRRAWRRNGPFGWVREDAAADFEGDPEALREPAVASFLLQEVREVAWRVGGNGWTARRGAEATRWTLRRNRTPDGDAPAAAENLAALLDALRRLRFASVRGVVSQGSPAGEVVVSGEKGPIVSLAFGPATDGGTWGRSSWRPGIVGAFETTGWASVLAAAETIAP